MVPRRGDSRNRTGDQGVADPVPGSKDPHVFWLFCNRHLPQGQSGANLRQKTDTSHTLNIPDNTM